MFSLPRSHGGKYIRIYLSAGTYVKQSEVSWTICTCTRYIVYTCNGDFNSDLFAAGIAV